MPTTYSHPKVHLQTDNKTHSSFKQITLLNKILGNAYISPITSLESPHDCNFLFDRHKLDDTARRERFAFEVVLAHPDAQTAHVLPGWSLRLTLPEKRVHTHAGSS